MTDQSTKLLRGAFAAVFIVAMASPAIALDAGANKCRSSIAKAYGKLISTTGKTLQSCHKSRDLAKIVVADCNAYPADAANVDPKGKIATAAGKLADAITKSCVGQDELLRADYYTSCPEPCATQIGTANPMTTWTEVGDCLACVGSSMVVDMYASAMGVPTLPLSSDDAKCHSAIGKGYQKYMDALIKGRQSCQGSEDKINNDWLAPCNTSDPKGKGAKMLTKANDGIEKSCATTTADLGKMDSCANTSWGDLKTCLGSAFDVGAAAGFKNSYELTATVCPKTIQTVIRAGCSNGPGLTADPAQCVTGKPTDSSLSVGWTGIAHGADFPDQYSLSASVTCPGSVAGTCGDCVIDGISSTDPQYAAFARCKADPSIPCNTPFAPNAVCPSGGECSYFLGAPLAISAGGAFTCSLNSLFKDIEGTANPDNGNSQLNLELRSLVATGESQVQPCPLCIGDEVPQDGIKSGVCLGGAKDSASNPGWTCDVQAFDLTFAGDPLHNGPSLDCPSTQAANISGTGLAIKLPLTTHTTSLPFANACDPPNAALMCACGQCTGDHSIACRNDAECAAAGIGTCTTNGGGSATVRKPNQCAGYTCVEVGATDRGECGGATAVDMFCDGFLRANGKGILTCLDDDSCHALDPACPGGNCGVCTFPGVRSCYLDPIETTGTADTHNPTLAGTFCLPPTANVSINETTGSPGAGEVKVDAIIHRTY